jgi:hypothetical protein
MTRVDRTAGSAHIVEDGNHRDKRFPGRQLPEKWMILFCGDTTILAAAEDQTGLPRRFPGQCLAV